MGIPYFASLLSDKQWADYWVATEKCDDKTRNAKFLFKGGKSEQPLKKSRGQGRGVVTPFGMAN